MRSRGNGLSRCSLYADLNSLYEIDTRYKPDMQRLARRTRLLAMYVPQTFYDYVKALQEKQARSERRRRRHGGERSGDTDGGDGAGLGTAWRRRRTMAPPTFTKWQDYVGCRLRRTWGRRR